MQLESQQPNVTIRSRVLLVLLILFVFSAHAQDEKLNPNKRKGPMQPAPAAVPYQTFDITLGQPTTNSIVFSLLRYDRDASAMILYGTQRNELNKRQPTPMLFKDKPYELTLGKLNINTQYYYELRDLDTSALLAAGSFHTQRPAGEAFTFTISADSHLDNNADEALYLRTLSNIVADHSDFHIDLGDTFMTGKHASRENAAKQYLAQRFYFSHLDSPLFLVLGNHDGEMGKQRKGGSNSLATWASTMRTSYFPNPKPDSFYSGNEHIEPNVGQLEDYYAWTWGDALFIVLNPYWQAAPNGKTGRWTLSLGKEQYDWLQDTLAKSQAKHKLVFVHQLIGGIDRQGRGGTPAVPFGEWGGKNADGSDGFEKHRTGWEMPIHSMLLKYGVNAVFHGHDHLFATQQLDGIIYQEVPQPAHPGLSTPKGAETYGYGPNTGTILGGSGHMRVQVSSDQITADYVRSELPRNGLSNNGEVLHHYTIQAISTTPSSSD